MPNKVEIISEKQQWSFEKQVHVLPRSGLEKAKYPLFTFFSAQHKRYKNQRNMKTTIVEFSWWGIYDYEIQMYTKMLLKYDIHVVTF